jgi:hypothetical protein
MKNARPNVQKMNLQHNARKKLFENRPSEAWFPSYSLLTTEEDAQSAHLQLQCSVLHI